MIWEQNVRVIIMVTKCQEGEFIKREKCHQYWPDKDSVPVQYGSITVGLLSSEKYCRDNFKMRKLDVRNGVETRIVYHFQYLRWPDKQNPEDPEGLLEYREAIRDTMMQFEDGPVVVHCSAGVGRSGTYIAVDTLLQRMEDHDTVDIFGLILKLRNYRVYMVQTEGQYMFVHQCLLLAMDNKKKQEVDAGHVYANSVPEEDFNPYENIPLAKRSKDGEQKTLFSSGSRKRKSKVVGSKYIEKDYENIAMIEDKRKSPPPIPTKPESPKEPGQYNKGMTSSREFLYENGNVNDGKNDVKESSENEDSYKGNNPSSEVASDESIVLVEDK
ncbi:receptor-type tyrosine-protein phosphatase C-like [Liolophura sinensis]|uniref:receptor-type tyrosine-protein phosphatase C-like n=1 Tax=Liolophura sinensis TaxID=3198878 RepID=UPI0031584C73